MPAFKISYLPFILILLGLSGSGDKREDAVPKGQAAPFPIRQGFDGPAELPRLYVKSSLTDSPAHGRVFNLKEGGNLRESIQSLNCGDTLMLQAGATFATDGFTLPARQCDDQHWIILRTGASDSELPPEGTRVTPCYAGIVALPGRPDYHCNAPKKVMAKIVFTAKGGSPITFADGANHYRFIGLEVTRESPGAVVYNLAQPAKDGVMDHILFDRVWFHGTAEGETTRGIFLGGSTYVAVIDSYFNDFHCTSVTGACVDSQAISGGTGSRPMGPYKIVNNFLEAGAETIMFGGGSATATPADIEIRRNHMFKPPNWMAGHPQFIGAADGRPFIVKNLFELKNATRVLLDGNIMENSWGGFSQSGFAVLLTPKNQAAKIGNVCPDCYVTDVTIRNCRISHVGGGLQIANAGSDNGGVPKDGQRYSIHDITIDDIQAQPYKGYGVFAQISMSLGAPTLRNVQIDHVTAFPPKSLLILGGPIGEPRVSGIFITNSVFTGGAQPIVTTGGGVDRNCSAQPTREGVVQVFEKCYASYAFHHNVIVGSGDWPKGNAMLRNVNDIGFVDFKDGNGGDYRLAKNSKFEGAAMDRKDVGADIEAIEKATQGGK